MTVSDRPTYDAGITAADLERDIDRPLAAGQRQIALGVTAPPPRVRISLKRLASGEWQPDFSVETFDADPATDAGYELIVRRLEGTDSLVRQRIALFLGRDAGKLDAGEPDGGRD